MNDTQHITKSDYDAFELNIMNQEEKERFLEHICSCSFCSDQFAVLSSENIIEAPRNMKDNILRATKRPEIQIAAMARKSSLKMQYYIYCLKVGTATVAALLLLLFTVNNTKLHSLDPIDQRPPSITQEETEPFTKTIRSRMDALSVNILDFSNRIMNTEVIKND